MTFPGSYRNKGGARSGMLIIDILLALSLAALFTAVITQSSSSARDLFERAKIRKEMIDKYEFTESVNLYGSDRIEITESIGGETEFNKIKSNQTNYLDLAGWPLCSVVFNGQPTITPINLPIDPLLPMTDLEVRDDVAYISADSANSSDPDLLVADFSGTEPLIRSSINTGPGLRSITLARNRIYGAAASIFAQLHVVLLNSLDNLSLDNRIRLALPYATATPPFASSIFYYKEKLFLGTEKWAGQELAVFDVREPSSPEYLNGYETGSKINDILVRDNLAYLATSDEEQLEVLDVSYDPVSVDALRPSGWERQEGKVVSLFEDEITFGRTAGGFNISREHEMFNGPDFDVSKDVPGGVYGIISDRSSIYLISRDVGKEFQIIGKNISTSSPETFSLPVAPQTLTCDGSNLYILAQTAPVIYEISFQ